MYFSQNVATCGADVEKACGCVSLANAIVLFGMERIEPAVIIANAKNMSAFDSTGLAPESLRLLCVRMGLHADLVQPCSASALAPGMLMYVRSIGLLNSQGGVTYENSVQDSHIVMVETIQPDGVIVVINPDRRRCGKGFTTDKWGRMTIAPGQLADVWRTSRVNGAHTSCAVVATARSVIDKTEIR